MRVFVSVIDAGSFTRAASTMNISQAAVTRLVSELEDHLGARLLNRTTRRLALTEVGEAYLDKARQILLEVEEASALAGASTREPRGQLRVLSPPSFAVHQLAKLLPRFRALYPKVAIEVFAPGLVDAVDETFDVTILLLSRPPRDSESIVRRLARTEVITCAAPEYLDGRGRPEHPRDLAKHETLIPRLPGRPIELTFHRGPFGDDEPEGESCTVTPMSPALATLHADMHYAAVLSGLGIAGLPSFVVEDALMEHALERVLPQWHLMTMTLYAGFPTRKHVPARTRAFIDFLLEEFGGVEHDPWLAAAGCSTAFSRTPAPAETQAAPQKV